MWHMRLQPGGGALSVLNAGGSRQYVLVDPKVSANVLISCSPENGFVPVVVISRLCVLKFIVLLQPQMQAITNAWCCSITGKAFRNSNARRTTKFSSCLSHFQFVVSLTGYFMTCFYFQGTQHVGQGASISADTVYFVKDSSANNHSIIAPWARPSELKKNSVY